MYLLTNDSSFRSILEKQDELCLSQLGWTHLTTIHMLMTLEELVDDMAWFLYDNYDKFKADPEQDEEYARAQVEVYLNTLEEEEVRELYYQYVEPWTVLEDLMMTFRSDRLAILADIRKCDEEELERFDTIWAN
jgi:hypothetical protein